MGIEKNTTKERETLIFQSPERAEEFTAHIEQRIKEESTHDVSRGREVVSEELVKQFDQHGHGVAVLSHPWEHSVIEHAEAQELVNTAFTKDLSAAIAQAENSPLFPQNIDLFHDVLTGEVYEAVSRMRMNTQTMSYKMVTLLGLFAILVLGVISILLYSL